LLWLLSRLGDHRLGKNATSAAIAVEKALELIKAACGGRNREYKAGKGEKGTK
jgi:hypothetical protein